MDARSLLERYGRFARKTLGQNFLIDVAAIDRIAAIATRVPTPAVIEIGPGLGALTGALLTSGLPVIGLEKDPALAEILRAEIDDERLSIIVGDATAVRFEELAGPGAAVAGNLPYNVASRILDALSTQRAAVGPTTVMVQREVAERIVARPGTKAYGAMSVMLQLFADIEPALELGPESFHPSPKVHSTVLAIDWRPVPRVAVRDLAAFERVTRAAFALRRKTLRNALSQAFARDAVAEAESRTGLDLGRRGETLELAELAALAAALVDPAGS